MARRIHMIISTTITIRITAVHMPALKISPINSQPDMVNMSKIRIAEK